VLIDIILSLLNTERTQLVGIRLTGFNTIIKSGEAQLLEHNDHKLVTKGEMKIIYFALVMRGF
jgi:hypothetical protein